GLELGEVLRHQRVGGRDRGDRHPYVHRPEREERVIDRVVGEDHERPRGIEPSVEQPLRGAARERERLAVAELPPGAVPALGEESPVRRVAGPALEPFADRTRMPPQLQRRAQDHRAVAATLDFDTRRREPQARPKIRPHDLLQGAKNRYPSFIPDSMAASRNPRQCKIRIPEKERRFPCRCPKPNARSASRRCTAPKRRKSRRCSSPSPIRTSPSRIPTPSRARWRSTRSRRARGSSVTRSGSPRRRCRPPRRSTSPTTGICSTP